MAGKWILFMVIFISISSCHRIIETEEVNIAPAFHDNSSKVWMIDKIMKDNKNYAPILRQERDLFVFYSTGKCLLTPIDSLSKSSAHAYGRFLVNSAEKEIRIIYKDGDWIFKITTFEDNEIVLKPVRGSYKYDLHLISFPEL